MANLISHGFVFWYPTMSLASGQAGVVNDPNRTWFKDIYTPPASSVEYFQLLSLIFEKRKFYLVWYN